MKLRAGSVVALSILIATSAALRGESTGRESGSWPRTEILRTQTVGAHSSRSWADPQPQSAAPAKGSSPSLVVDNQIHLGSASHLFRFNKVFLWTSGDNTALGMSALSSNTSGSVNTAVGNYALSWNNTGWYNDAFGAYALLSNTSGSQNSAFGNFALRRNTSGSNNSAFGDGALLYHETGSYNIAIGSMAGSNLEYVYPGTGASTYSHNIFIDNSGGADDEKTIRIGNPIHERAFIKGIRGTTTDQANALPVLVDSVGQLGTVNSSREVKQDITEIGDLSRRLLSLRPVAFRYRQHARSDPETPYQFGLIAEEVVEVFPELVVFNRDGEPETVKYHLLSALLLNELQRQAQVNEEQGRQLSDLAAIVEELSAGTKP